MQTNIERKVSRGMWVVTDDNRLGILTDLAPLAGVDLVSASGETTLSIVVPFQSLRQAMLEEIPEARRPEPEVGARMGYL